jgi:hypothetical protein
METEKKRGGRPRLNITDEERVKRACERTKEWMKNHPNHYREYVEKIRNSKEVPIIRGRPKKYATEEERLAAKKESKKRYKIKQRLLNQESQNMSANI